MGFVVGVLGMGWRVECRVYSIDICVQTHLAMRTRAGLHPTRRPDPATQRRPSTPLADSRHRGVFQANQEQVSHSIYLSISFSIMIQRPC
jgi:hypothetical protein